MQLDPYLHFGGTCEEALEFYCGVFGGEITAMNRYGNSPMGAEAGPEAANKVLHARFKAGDLHFMASDVVHRPVPTNGDGNISLSVSLSDPTEGEHIFNALSEGGVVEMPWADQFWGAKFGAVVDRYGIDWMVNCETPTAP